LYISLKVKGKTHNLNHDLIFSAHTINCVCHSIRSMFKVLGVYNFDENVKKKEKPMTRKIEIIFLTTH
jgi:hypothetical protein